MRTAHSTYHVRDWIEARREYERQLVELAARIAARGSATYRQVERLAQQGNVTQ